MKRGKHEKEKFKIIEAYSVLILIAALFMCIGYADISGMDLDIEGKIDTVAQTGVFITNVSYIYDNEADTINSKINYYLGTMLNSEIALGNNNDSSITYQVTIYNSTNTEQLFIDTLVDSSIPNSYTNENIEFVLNGIEIGKTTISAKESLNFTITFKYIQNADVTNSILKNILNFRFQENPILILSNEDETYTLNNIYPDYISEEYQFTVSNYGENGINNVPMTYHFEIKIDSPLLAKIYDENGNEVIDNIIMDGDEATQIQHAYTLKVIWDNSNTEENIDYNSPDYANKEFNCIVDLKASPIGEKYLEYTITKGFDINITTEPFYFDTEIDNTEIEFSDNRAEFDLNIKNTDETSENVCETTYKITLENNDKLILYVNGEVTVNNEITKVINIENDVLNIELIPEDGIELDMEEQCKLKIETVGKYLKTESYEISISRDLGINPKLNTEYMTPVKYQNGQWVKADTTVPGEWHDYGYQKWANVVTDNGYFVFVPRFAYKITSGYHETLDTAGTVAIVYLNEDNTLKTTKDSEGNIVDSSDLVTADQVNSSVANTGINATTKYIIHPAFTAFDTDEQKIDGLWVAKYQMSMETTTDGGTTWSHTSVESTTVGNVSITSSTTKRMVSKPGVSSWRYIDVTNIFDNCYYMNTDLDSHMMKNTEWGAVAYLGMSKYGKGSEIEIESNKSEDYLTGYGANGTLSTGAASTTGNMYGIFDLAGGSHEYVAGYVEDTCLDSGGSLYSTNESLVLAEDKYKDVYKVGTSNTSEDCYTANNLRVGDALWEVSSSTDNLAWFADEFDFAGLSSYDNGHYPIFDRGGDYGSWSSNTGINYAGRNNGASHPGVTFRTVIYVK